MARERTKMRINLIALVFTAVSTFCVAQTVSVSASGFGQGSQGQGTLDASFTGGAPLSNYTAHGFIQDANGNIVPGTEHSDTISTDINGDWSVADVQVQLAGGTILPINYKVVLIITRPGTTPGFRDEITIQVWN
jgi:hypothetical protein